MCNCSSSDIIFLSKSFNTVYASVNQASEWLKYQFHIVSLGRMKIILFKLWLKYIQKAITEQSLSNRPSCQSHSASQNSLWNQWRCYTAQRSSYCIYLMFALVKSLVRVQKLRCNDKIFIHSIIRLSSAQCSSLQPFMWRE